VILGAFDIEQSGLKQE